MIRLAVTVLEVPFVVELVGVSPDVPAALARAWSWCGARVLDPGEPADGRRVTAAVGVGADVVADDATALADLLTGHLTREAISARRHELLMLHACAVADPVTGGVLALVGPSGRGKTTAAAVLGRQLGYVTDETAAVRADGTVVPYGKPLSVTDPATAPWKRQVGPAELGLQRPPAALHLRGVVLLDRQPGAAPQVQAVTFSDAVPDLVPQVSYLAALARPLHRLREAVAPGGVLHRITYDGAEQLLPAVREMLGGAPVSTSAPEEEELAGAAPSGSRCALVGRADVEHVPDGSAVVVLAGGEVQVLRGIGPALFAHCRQPATLAELTAAVVGRHGAPHGDGAQDLVAAAVDELVRSGVLRRTGNGD